MAGVIDIALRRLSLSGTAGRHQGQAANVMDAMAVSLERSHEFLRAVQDEANPGTATYFIDEWLLLLGVAAPYGATLGDKRALALSAWTSLGGASLEYINEQIRKVYPNAFIYEKEPDADELGMGEAEMWDLECSSATLTQRLYYVVSGYVDFAAQRYFLQALISHIIPAHLNQIFQTRAQYDGDVARCGVATAGRSICGRATTTYSPTAKETGIVAAGRCGTAITGRTA